MRDIDSFSVVGSNLSDQKLKTFQKEQFPLEELITTNKSILDAIVSLEAPHDSSVMQSYLEQTPIPAIIDRTLNMHLNPEAAADQSQRQ